jgi:hypothetical protein
MNNNSITFKRSFSTTKPNYIGDTVIELVNISIVMNLYDILQQAQYALINNYIGDESIKKLVDFFPCAVSPGLSITNGAYWNFSPEDLEILSRFKDGNLSVDERAALVQGMHRSLDRVYYQERICTIILDRASVFKINSDQATYITNIAKDLADRTKF